MPKINRAFLNGKFKKEKILPQYPLRFPIFGDEIE
jgi:hypothetical protein